MEPNSEAEKLKREQERLKYEKEIFALEQQKYALEQERQKLAQFSGKSEGIANEITTDDSFGYFAELTAYRSFLDAARQVAHEIEAQLRPDDRLLISLNKQMLQPFANYQLLKLQLKDWAERLQGFAPANEEGESSRAVAPPPSQQEVKRGGIGPVSMAASGVYGALSMAGDILKFFNYSTDVSSRDTKINAYSIYAKVVDAIQQGKVSGLSVYLEDFIRVWEPGAKGILHQLNEAYRAATRLEKISMDPDHPQRDSAAQLLTGFREYLSQLAAIGEGQAQSPLAQALLQERVEDLGITKILYLEVASSGGEASVRKGFLSFFNSGVKYVGGGVLSYTLADVAGHILRSNTIVSQSMERLKY